MKAFADLYTALDQTTKTSVKVRAMADYFRRAAPADAAWAVYFLCGRKPRQVVPTRKLASWAIAEAHLPDWLFDESYLAVGDLAETIALLLPPPTEATHDVGALAEWVEERLLPLRGAPEQTQREEVLRAWRVLNDRQRFVWNKLITGAFRVGVSQQLVTRALAEVGGVEAAALAHRLMGDWAPTAAWYERLMGGEAHADDVGRPYPFFLASPLEGGPEGLGDVHEWLVEWKWDGIRAQLIHRSGNVFLWSRGEELITERFPELATAATALPVGTVLDGEVLPWHEENDQVLPFAALQRRIGRKVLTRKVLSEVPVVLVTYDLLEDGGRDVRELPLAQRRERLEALLGNADTTGRLRLSPRVSGTSWDDLAGQREQSRQRHVEGLMLKRLSSPYRVGRVRGDWWKWKVNPFTIDAVLVYAQRGSGKRASLYTDYTFAVWDNGALVPVAKAYSGLTDAEIRQVDAFVRNHTVEKFGPVRSVRPELVFELGFEGIQLSTRHKSGVAVRFPRILRWRQDKPAHQADTVQTIRALLPPAAVQSGG